MLFSFKPKTTIGRPDASIKQDIELIGVGISPEHCVIEVKTPNQIVLTPLNKSKFERKKKIFENKKLNFFYFYRTYVNGQLIDNERQLRHGDRILLGCSHFFRLNFPGDKSKFFSKIIKNFD